MDWSNRFSDKVNIRLEDSAIAVMMNIAAREGALLLAAGEPLEELCPSERLKKAFERAHAQEAHTWGYSQSRTGVFLLRKWIFEWMMSDGLLPDWTSPDNVFITNGSQEGLALLTESLLDPGDTVMVESPSYPDAFGVFRKEGLHLAGVDLLPDGPDVSAMERLLAEGKVKVFYTIPTFQNPTGFTTCHEKKIQILDLARKHDFLVIEDEPYRDISFDAPPQGSYMAAAGEDDRVLYMGSFSKTIAPGLRCGWVVAPQSLVEVLLKLRTAGTLCLPDIVQQAVYEFVSESDFGEHLKFIRDAYRKNRDAMVDSLTRHAGPEGLAINVPSGGFFIWGRIPWINDTEKFVLFAMKEEKVAAIPGTHFFPVKGKGVDTIRFSFARVTPEKAEEGAKRMRDALRKYRMIQEGEGKK
jgi:2-aminoadipate transaminase